MTYIFTDASVYKHKRGWISFQNGAGIGIYSNSLNISENTLDGTNASRLHKAQIGTLRIEHIELLAIIRAFDFIDTDSKYIICTDS